MQLQSTMKHVQDVLQGKAAWGNKRSSQWFTVRKKHLQTHGTCAVCGGTSKLEVHHKMSFHAHPGRELDPGNLITLCESKKNGVTCHLLFGHLGNYRAINDAVDADVAQWHHKIVTRQII